MELKALRTGASLIETMPLLSRKLLNEKNEEIDQLTKELGELHEYVSQLERGVLSNVSGAKFIIYVLFLLLCIILYLLIMIFTYAFH